MNKLLILIVVVFVICDETKDLIMIGDHRIEGMAIILIGAEMTSFKYKGGYYSAIMTPKLISYNDYNVEITAVTIVNNLINEFSDPTIHVHNQLKNAKDGTNVLLSIA